MKPVKMPPVSQGYTVFTGGFDTDTPAVERKPGWAIGSTKNYEQAVNGGYVTSLGYEAHNGKAKPSEAVYHMLPVSTPGTNAANGTATITGAISGATGVIVAATTTHLVITVLTGSFVAENASPGGVVITGAQQANAASTQLLSAQYKNLAADVYRALIAAVPGSGIIRGIYAFFDPIALPATADGLYVFRNNAGGTAGAIYKRTTAGWLLVNLGEEISFSNANTSVGDADTLTQGAVTALIGRVVVQTGTLASGVNTGRLILSGRAGGNFGAGAATSTGGGALTLSAIQTGITLLPGGQYNFITETFGGSTAKSRIYGADGVNRGFEFDGTTFVPIATGNTPDTPKHVYKHKNHLFFSFGGSAQHSGVNDPYSWLPITGAAELSMGDTITGFMKQAGGSAEAALTIITRNSLSTVYGSGSTTWQIVPYKQEAGGINRTIQQVEKTIMLDDRGLAYLEAVQEYGNFADVTLSYRIQTWLAAKKALVTCSCIMRDKNQYRLFFSDKSALYVTIKGGSVVGMMPMKLSHVVHTITSVEDGNGKEVVYFGDENGMVHQMESGTSFNGNPIEATLETAFDNLRNSTQLKQYRNIVIEIAGGGYSEFTSSYKIGYGSTNYSQAPSTSNVVSLGGANWDDNVLWWDQADSIWDSVPLLPIRIDLGGTAENISFKFSSNSDYLSPINFSGGMLTYTPRRLQR